MFPIVLTGVVTAGILYFLGLELNIFSTVVCTLVFGVGDDFSIFLTQAMQKEHTTGKNELPTYRISIILAVFTTILSIGSLIFAKHPALHFPALVALIGMFSVIIITSTLYPFWFRLFITNRAKKDFLPSHSDCLYGQYSHSFITDWVDCCFLPSEVFVKKFQRTDPEYYQTYFSQIFNFRSLF